MTYFLQKTKDGYGVLVCGNCLDNNAKDAYVVQPSPDHGCSHCGLSQDDYRKDWVLVGVMAAISILVCVLI